MEDIDPELAVMAAVSKALSTLQDEESRQRVVGWAASKFGVAVAHATIVGREVKNGPSDKPANPTFDRFVDLFDSVSPGNDLDRGLTAAYWIQVIGSNDSWNSYEVNALLKDMGHGLTHIATTFTRAQDLKPALVRQISKSGKTQQAKKTYKLTSAGITHITTRLNTPADKTAEV